MCAPMLFYVLCGLCPRPLFGGPLAQVAAATPELAVLDVAGCAVTGEGLAQAPPRGHDRVPQLFQEPEGSVFL